MPSQASPHRRQRVFPAIDVGDRNGKEELPDEYAVMVSPAVAVRAG